MSFSNGLNGEAQWSEKTCVSFCQVKGVDPRSGAVCFSTIAIEKTQENIQIIKLLIVAAKTDETKIIATENQLIKNKNKN